MCQELLPPIAALEFSCMQVNGTNAQKYPFHSRLAMRTYNIVNVNSGKVLDVYGGF